MRPRVRVRRAGSKVRLLSVSFDPQRDTPAVLKRYAETFRQTAGGPVFDRWEFVAAPPNELKDVADFFGLYFSGTGDQIVHSMSTTVIGPNGTSANGIGIMPGRPRIWSPTPMWLCMHSRKQRPQRAHKCLHQRLLLHPQISSSLPSLFFSRIPSEAGETSVVAFEDEIRKRQ